MCSCVCVFVCECVMIISTGEVRGGNTNTGICTGHEWSIIGEEKMEENRGKQG